MTSLSLLPPVEQRVECLVLFARSYPAVALWKTLAQEFRRQAVAVVDALPASAGSLPLATSGRIAHWILPPAGNS